MRRAATVLVLLAAALAASAAVEAASVAEAASLSKGRTAPGKLPRSCEPTGRDGCPAVAAAGPEIAVRGGGGAGARASAARIAPVAGPSVFSGLGFDACTAPPPRTMRAWKASSPYDAIGVYIGGLNRACSQPNLTADWVEEQVEAGWHLIPTYVGLQSPTSSCTSCAKLSSAAAARQGEASAGDAVADAQAIGMGPGSPIYFDMESYTRTSSATSATLTFLNMWTKRLHALGYASGVYSSSASGIADLASRADLPGYTLPDNLWIANWNGRRTTDDPFVPDDAWTRHQRIHQYRGGHDETWGGVTINIDNDYVDAATVGEPASQQPLPPLTVSRVRAVGATVLMTIRCGWPVGITCPGQILLRANVRIPLRGRGGRVVGTKAVRRVVARRGFRLGGGRRHIFRVVLNSQGRPLLLRSGGARAQLLVAVPGSRATRKVRLPQRR